VVEFQFTLCQSHRFLWAVGTIQRNWRAYLFQWSLTRDRWKIVRLQVHHQGPFLYMFGHLQVYIRALAGIHSGTCRYTFGHLQVYIRSLAGIHSVTCRYTFGHLQVYIHLQVTCRSLTGIHSITFWYTFVTCKYTFGHFYAFGHIFCKHVVIFLSFAVMLILVYF
jgi:hypothetical protein